MQGTRGPETSLGTEQVAVMKTEDVLANCIDEILNDKSTVEDCLARYPDLADELRPLLHIAASIPPERGTPSPEFKQRTRNRLLEAMGPQMAHVKYGRQSAGGWFRLRLARAFSPAVLALIVLSVVVVAGGGTAYASQSSLPGDTLYPVKTGVENLQLAVTFSHQSRADLHLKLAERRIDEAAMQLNLKRALSAPALATVARQIDEALREMEQALPEDTTPLLTRLAQSTLNQQVILGQLLTTCPQAAQPALRQALEVMRRGNIIAQVAYGNPAFLDSSPSVLDQTLEEGQFKLDGVLLKVEGRTWNIGGVIIDNVVSSHEVPPIGKRVRIEGLARDNETFISKIEHDGDTNAQVNIEGLFGGASQNGAVWRIGGIPVGVSGSRTPPLKGDQVKLNGTVQNGNLTVAQVEIEKGSRSDEVNLHGVLAEVNASRKVITINVAGAKFEVNLAEAVIEAGDGRPVTWSVLPSLVGEDVRIDGAYLKDGLLYARKVRIDVELGQPERQSHGESPKSQQGNVTPQKGESGER